MPKFNNVEKKWLGALHSHLQGKKHKGIRVDSYSPASTMFFQGNLSAQKTDAVSVKKPATLDNLVVSVSAAKREIRYVIKLVDSNFSLRSCFDLNNFFASDVSGYYYS